MNDEDFYYDDDKDLNSYDLLFDEDKARKAASAVKIFQDVSVGSSKEKMKEAGTQERHRLYCAFEFCGQDDHTGHERRSLIIHT